MAVKIQFTVLLTVLVTCFPKQRNQPAG